MRKHSILIGILAAVTLCCGLTEAAILHVPADYATIVAAINAAANGDTVLVADGTYSGPGFRSIGWYNKNITLQSENGPDNCTIDGEDNYQCFTFWSNTVNRSSLVEGFTIINGYNSESGGGMSCSYGSSPTVRNCVFRENESDEGGGIYCRNASPAIEDCRFVGNTANRGGGIYFGDYSNVRLANCTFTSNSAVVVDTNSAFGGAIYCGNSSDFPIENCGFYNNTSATDGGALYTYDAEPALIACVFSGNYAQRNGGGAYIDRSASEIYKCNFVNNNSYVYGGGLYLSLCSMTISKCRVSGNSASFGGGIRVYSNPSPEIVNCLIVGNSTTNDGGGMSIRNNSGCQIKQCTFADNAAWHGDALEVDNSSPAITNCIIWDTSDNEISLVSGSPTFSYCCIRGGYAGTGNISANPEFVAGPAGNYYLDTSMKSSPCIDAGDGNADAVCFSTDQESYCMSDLTTRTDQVTDSATVDMGYHYEYVDVTPTPTATDTPALPTDTPAPPTDTPSAPTDTPAPPTDTPAPPTDTPVPGTPTPTPTPTPAVGIFRGSIDFERSDDPPDPSWSVPVTFSLCDPDDPGAVFATYTADTDQNGNFMVQVAAGTWDILVKNSHTLANKVDSVTVPAGGWSAPADCGTLAEGDANDDNAVSSLDFFILRASYNKSAGEEGYDDRADFNEDDIVNSSDFFLMKSHYNDMGADCGT